MAELSDFLPYVRRHISGPLNIMMTDALSMAAVAFSRQSLVCRREVTVVPVAGKEIVLPYDKDDEECVHIIRISDDNHELFVGRDVDISSGRSLRFACSPGEVSVLYAVAPKAGRSQIPDELLTWPEEVAAGHLSGCSCRLVFHGRTRHAHSIFLCSFLRGSVGHIVIHWRQARTLHTATLYAGRGFTDDDDYRNHRTCEYTTG